MQAEASFYFRVKMNDLAVIDLKNVKDDSTEAATDNNVVANIALSHPCNNGRWVGFLYNRN